nr:hypothetical protein [Bradyrhizobium sp. CCBAU 11445]
MQNLYRYVNESLNHWARLKYKGLKNEKSEPPPGSD